ncbi:unnamed protein product [Cylindrotheca closterium]|uniref:Uncharacterized protein n=1 Tax=Cylindrotheca closterium TaxID=2856 RepID=A0AAD2G2C4_9STRA|nr:unnamed protein product [Cylindrotheca closterium]
MKFTATVLSLFAFMHTIDSFGINQQKVAKTSEIQISRSNFLALVGAGVTVAACSVPPAFAKDSEAELKGTKKDPNFETCLSTCMYECTKPKGVEQKSRKECLPECKAKCATNKNQLLLGDPKAAE